MVEIPLRRGTLNITEEEISVQHSMAQYAKNILNSWHGPVWGLVAVLYITLNGFLAINSNTLDILFATGEIILAFFVFLAGMHILRFQELPLTREHIIKTEEVIEIKSKIAMNAETWFVREMFEISFQRDGKSKKIIIMPLKEYEDKLQEKFADMDYPIEDN